MIAFASNSLLCRLALKQTSIDAASFTFVRIFSGAAALWLIMKMRDTAWKQAGNWPSALALFVYAAAFRLHMSIFPPEPERCFYSARSRPR